MSVPVCKSMLCVCVGMGRALSQDQTHDGVTVGRCYEGKAGESHTSFSCCVQEGTEFTGWSHDPAHLQGAHEIWRSR